FQAYILSINLRLSTIEKRILILITDLKIRKILIYNIFTARCILLACVTADITETPSAPASITAEEFYTVIPPMPVIGIVGCKQRNVFIHCSPVTSASALDVVRNTVPAPI